MSDDVWASSRVSSLEYQILFNLEYCSWRWELFQSFPSYRNYLLSCFLATSRVSLVVRFVGYIRKNNNT